MRAKLINEIRQNIPGSGLGALGVGKEGIKSLIDDWMYVHEIKSYIINDDLTLDVRQDVVLTNYIIGEFPYYINFRVTGNFTCIDCELTSLKGVPRL